MCFVGQGIVRHDGEVNCCFTSCIPVHGYNTVAHPIVPLYKPPLLHCSGLLHNLYVNSRVSKIPNFTESNKEKMSILMPIPNS